MTFIKNIYNYIENHGDITLFISLYLFIALFFIIFIISSYITGFFITMIIYIDFDDKYFSSLFITGFIFNISVITFLFLIKTIMMIVKEYISFKNNVNLLLLATIFIIYNIILAYLSSYFVYELEFRELIVLISIFIFINSLIIYLLYRFYRLYFLQKRKNKKLF